MAEPARKPATYDDLLEVPDHRVAEIVDGELVVSPRPAVRHAVASSSLGADINGAFHRGRGGPGGWWILFEPELHLGDHVLVPDLAGWRRERVPSLPDVVGVTVPPDWVCEVLSPSTRSLDRMRKLPIYAAFEVRHAWLLDPIDQTLEVFRLDGDHWTLLGVHGGDEEVRVEPFDAVPLDLSALWDLGEPPAPPEGP